MRINDFKLEEFFAKYAFSTPYLLCSSDCEPFNVGELLSLDEHSEEELKKLWLDYTESQGNPLLREEISKLYENIEPEEVIVLTGAEEGIFIFMNVLLDKADHIIVQYPSFQSLFEVAISIGCEVTKWEMSDQNNWELDIDFLKNNIKKNTKVIVINCPHNPTGYLMSNEKFNMIIDIAKKNGIYIFSDEVYRFLEYNDKDRLPAMCDLYYKGISLGDMSKTFALPGLRIGWIATKDKSLIKKIISFKHYTSICNSAPSEFFSILVLKNKEYFIKRNLKLIENNLKFLDKFFDDYKNLFTWVKPQAGVIAFPRIKFNKDVEDFCLDLLNKKGVLLMPSTYFDFGGKHFRIGFGRKKMPEALDKLKEYIQEHLEK
ncbi:Capreomycidine synthase [subsurface metagenome]